MSKSEQRQIAKYVVSEITCSPSTLDNGQRSPRKVGNLLESIDEMMMEEALEHMRNADTRIAQAIQIIKTHHTLRYKSHREGKNVRWEQVVDHGPAESTWMMVKSMLGMFARQEGSQQLMSKDDARAVLRQASAAIREMVEKGK